MLTSCAYLQVFDGFNFRLIALDHGTIKFFNLERVLFGPQAHDRF